ncbi:adenylate/guanylate cyclase domain-containing protein [Oscillatoria salina]|uniref:adenylate/guanylate cyclase domain-containing protein n=1 Tax=Oscillatoria salina TaxID=331517 RepID=UPI0013B67C65|nr:adenylate/guanylate cyclase domain-containing protein [Oscillatoria salina]MBZ8181025.1 FHA domain-containing protein [Oscillatoria salina IIICB1]NET88146.1 FHA domain-containing protein [Kamptonema sp. SIO1D9]
MSELKLRLNMEGNPESTVRVDRDEFIVGRLPECDLCLPFSEISRAHARFIKRSGEWQLEDLGSTNGTMLNRFQINSPQKLSHGDVIQMGNVFLFVVLPPHYESPSPPGSAKTELKTILRSAEELQRQWIEAEAFDDRQQVQQKAIARLKDLVEIAKNLNSAESIEAIFRQVQKVVFRELNSIERLALLIDVDGDGKLKLLNAATKNSTSRSSSSNKESSWISRTICQTVFTEKVAIKTVDAQSDERFTGEHSILAQGIRGALAVPLWNESQVVGVLYADAQLTWNDSQVLEDEDLSFFSALANLVASSVQRWLLTRKLQGQEKIRQQLERYHSPAVVQQLIAVGALENGRIQPQESEITVLFADLVGFSSLSERLSPSQIADLLNRFFEEMLKFVFDAGGTLDKFIGDCIMAFFGAPEPQADHADRAIAAALGMLEHLDRLNADGVWPEPLELHIAINSGKAVVGDVGSSLRVDYTVLGGTVNLASRMEAICPPGECVISEATYRRLKNRDPFVKMGDCRFKGIDRPIRVYRTIRRGTRD